MLTVRLNFGRKKDCLGALKAQKIDYRSLKEYVTRQVGFKRIWLYDALL